MIFDIYKTFRTIVFLK